MPSTRVRVYLSIELKVPLFAPVFPAISAHDDAVLPGSWHALWTSAASFGGCWSDKEFESTPGSH
jgi:hypothetical protein